jgi:hypothetical protein
MDSPMASTPKSGSPKYKLVTQLLGIAMKGKSAAQRKTARVALNGKTKAQLEAAIKVGKQMAAKAKAQGTTTAKPKSKKRGSIPKALLKRSRAISAAIKRGDLAVKQQISKASDYSAGTPKERHEKFVAKYSGARVSRRKGGAKRQSVKKIFAQMQGSKYPYYLSSGYKVKTFTVGGGKSGPGIIRSIPGSKAPPFSGLTKTEQAKIAKFLNTAQGQTLRAKGANKTVDLAAMRKIKAQKKAKKGTTASQQGSSNWW